MHDFDTLVGRRGSGSLKWDDTAEGTLPLWVADMDFTVAPPIQEAIRRRAEHGIFGYAIIPAAYYEALGNWRWRRHRHLVEREDVLVTPGVVPAISAALRALTRSGDGVVTLTPAYNCFFSSIRNMGCELLGCELRVQEHRFEVDFDDLAAKLSHPRARVFLLCSPHNPSGRVWTREELTRMYGLCERHGVAILCDEIHCDLTLPGQRFVALGSLGERERRNSVTFCSASKAFNLAGLQNAALICPRDDLRARINRALNDHEACDVNPFGIDATIAAYNEGEPWLGDLLCYLAGNLRLLVDFTASHLGAMWVARIEATYLPLLCTAALGLGPHEVERRLLREGVRLSPGRIYGADQYLRVNLATSRAQLLEALGRVARALGQP
ncbi:MAG: pyridoxal phosphate-dependent aminotransferase [Succinivibrionaceae bacterium]|nr:pyridoxal phosphate-dependent aminotransferase [Succinivibrionaceae bacterium]